ncbi:MAG TPA: hypothetical protein VG502_07200 [Flexivirga sp.]|uniref:hypothetical protein n=1 Tax=Flexivirga sp. TaxID=1962927 RepID=UPI002C6718E7|nr:hypothetical protein [Flexivirga sp.]HWC22071.1 hypothetical protein [Flexivirga sp.]
MTGVDTELTARTVAPGELEDITRRLTDGPHATIAARLRTRDLAFLARVRNGAFELLIPSESGVRLISGPAERLGGELVGLVTTLERSTGTTPPDEPPPAVDTPPLAPGELLALAEVIREGDPERLDAALEELEMTGLPWWVRQFAWGAEAIVTLQLVGSSVGFAAMLHLFTDGWGQLSADADDDLTFRPMTTIEVQARVNAFAALLQESSDDDD